MEIHVAGTGIENAMQRLKANFDALLAAVIKSDGRTLDVSADKLFRARSTVGDEYVQGEHTTADDRYFIEYADKCCGLVEKLQGASGWWKKRRIRNALRRLQRHRKQAIDLSKAIGKLHYKDEAKYGSKECASYISHEHNIRAYKLLRKAAKWPKNDPNDKRLDYFLAHRKAAMNGYSGWHSSAIAAMAYHNKPMFKWWWRLTPRGYGAKGKVTKETSNRTRGLFGGSKAPTVRFKKGDQLEKVQILPHPPGDEGQSDRSGDGDTP